MSIERLKRRLNDWHGWQREREARQAEPKPGHLFNDGGNGREPWSPHQMPPGEPTPLEVGSALVEIHDLLTALWDRLPQPDVLDELNTGGRPSDADMFGGKPQPAQKGRAGAGRAHTKRTRRRAREEPTDGQTASRGDV